MKRFLCFATVLLTLGIFLWPQAVEIKEKEDKPLGAAGPQDGQVRGLFSSQPSVKPDRYTIRYVSLSPGPSGSIQGLSKDSVLNQKLAEEFNFPSLDITVSVAARFLPEGIFQDSAKFEGSTKPLTELRQMCLNIKLSALDANKYVITQPIKAIYPALNEKTPFIREFGKEPIMTLGILPFESSYTMGESTQSKVSGSLQNPEGRVGLSQSLEAVGLGAVTPILNPFGTLISGVSAVFKIFSPTKNLPNEISYMTSDNEFGWIWRQQQNYGIEGIHHCQVLLRSHKTVKFILAEVELITDWKRFGAWMKQIDCIVPVVEGQQ